MAGPASLPLEADPPTVSSDRTREAAETIPKTSPRWLPQERWSHSLLYR
jgi:hypothetical protein